MSDRKAFFIGLFATLALILPVYFVFALISFSGVGSVPTENKQSNIPVAKPAASDAKTVLIIEDTEEAALFVLVRFDALKNKIVTTTFLGKTIMLANGKGTTLLDALRFAGPAQVAECIKETLGITVNNYIMASPERLVTMWHPLGTAQVNLPNYLSDEALSQLKLPLLGIEDIALTPTLFSEILHSEHIPSDVLCNICADGYLAFLRTNSDSLDTVLVNTFKKNINNVQTDIAATDIFDYDRILKFLVKGECEFSSIIFDGQMSSDRFELGEASPKTAVDNFV